MFHGSMVALVTPFHADDLIDWASLAQLVEWHLAEGTHAICVIGSTGEAGMLSTTEKQEIIRRVVTQVKGRVPVIAGTGETSTTSTIQLTQMAMSEGADACLLMTPAYVKPTQEGLFLHYKMVANAVPIPQILYNVPGRTASDLLPETIARLANLPNIVGVKEATGKIERVREIRALCDDKLDLFSGDDQTAMDFMLAGGKGVISVTANVAPRLMHDFYEAMARDEVSVAQALNDKLMAFHKAQSLEVNPIPVKWAMHEMGKIPAGIRLPLTPLSETHHLAVRHAMRQADII